MEGTPRDEVISSAEVSPQPTVPLSDLSLRDAGESDTVPAAPPAPNDQSVVASPDPESASTGEAGTEQGPSLDLLSDHFFCWQLARAIRLCLNQSLLKQRHSDVPAFVSLRAQAPASIEYLHPHKPPSEQYDISPLLLRDPRGIPEADEEELLIAEANRAHRFELDVLGEHRELQRKGFFKRKEDGVVVVKDYAPVLFAALRHADHISDMDMDLAWHFAGMKSVPVPSEGAGRSGSLFMFSKDRRFLFKTLPPKELATLLELLPAYYCYLRQNPASRLMRFYGLHRVQNKMTGTTVHLAVSNNVLWTKDSLPLHRVYDLKGRAPKPGKDRRKLDVDPSKYTFKDNDLERWFSIPEDEREPFMNSLRKDVAFLSGHFCMDYSLLVGVVASSDELSVLSDKDLSRVVFKPTTDQDPEVTTSSEVGLSPKADQKEAAEKEAEEKEAEEKEAEETEASSTSSSTWPSTPSPPSSPSSSTPSSPSSCTTHSRTSSPFIESRANSPATESGCSGNPPEDPILGRILCVPAGDVREGQPRIEETKGVTASGEAAKVDKVPVAQMNATAAKHTEDLTAVTEEDEQRRGRRHNNDSRHHRHRHSQRKHRHSSQKDKSAGKRRHSKTETTATILSTQPPASAVSAEADAIPTSASAVIATAQVATSPTPQAVTATPVTATSTAPTMIDPTSAVDSVPTTISTDPPPRISFSSDARKPAHGSSSRLSLTTSELSSGPRTVSYLLCGRDETYLVGVIDFLAVYSKRKKSAHLFKRVRWESRQLSTVPPEYYAERFFDFCEQIFVLDRRPTTKRRNNPATAAKETVSTSSSKSTNVCGN